MRIKKMVSIILILFVSITLFTATKAFAATEENFGIKLFRKAVAGQQYGYETTAHKTVWKVVKYNSDKVNFDYENAIYCLKAEQGFQSAAGSHTPETYNLTYDYRDTSKPTAELSYYKETLWLLDNFYIQGQSTAADRAALIAAAGIPDDTDITDDDIDVVQQKALWYFTNADSSAYHSHDLDGITPLINLAIASKAEAAAEPVSPSFTNIDDIDSYRFEDIKDLFKYFVDGAKANAGSYTGTSGSAPIGLNSMVPSFEVSGENYIVGPYKIDKNNNNLYTLQANFKDQDNSNITNYTLLDSTKTAVTAGTEIKDLVGQQFYISIPKSSNISKVTFSIEGSSYSGTKLTYWTKGGQEPTTQPLVIVEKSTLPLTGSNTVNIVANGFDLSLRKFISKVGEVTVDREPVVDLTKLKNGTSTTAEYNHPKNPVAVKIGDVITYTIRVYNEGEKDGYVGVVTDFLPPELEFLNNEFNAGYGWRLDSNLRKVSTDLLSKDSWDANELDVQEMYPDGTLLRAFDGNELDYIDLQIQCKLKATAETGKPITNLAEITECTDENGDPVEDRDSEPGNIDVPSDPNLPGYKEDETGSYIPGQQDDDDFEKIIIQEFDLSLRKFITKINDVAVIGREPVVDVSKLASGEDTTAIYNHSKVPIDVVLGDIVTYTIRVYNEADIDGYASVIKDRLPPELEYLSEDELNIEYGWEVSEDGRTITTTYLSKENETTPKENLLRAFDGTELDYRDVKVNCKLKMTAEPKKRITNLAQISECTDENGNDIIDRDSQTDNMEYPTDPNLPGYKENETGSYVPGQQDDDDFEKIRVTFFDLALKKWVSKAIVIEDGKETVIETGHTGDEDPEPIVKVELNRKNLSRVVVKFEYQIKITNEGEIAGYAKEVTDYVPAGLRFVAEDNPQWYIRDNDPNKVGTRALEDKLLQPGESATVSILLTWNNGNDNLGLKTNIAEISEDYNDKKVPDIDSTPDNKVPGEDDIDDAPVLLSIATGQSRIYFGLGFVILITLAGGVLLIKKYVLI